MRVLLTLGIGAAVGYVLRGKRDQTLDTIVKEFEKKFNKFLDESAKEWKKTRGVEGSKSRKFARR